MLNLEIKPFLGCCVCFFFITKRSLLIKNVTHKFKIKKTDILNCSSWVLLFKIASCQIPIVAPQKHFSNYKKEFLLFILEFVYMILQMICIQFHILCPFLVLLLTTQMVYMIDLSSLVQT